MQDAHAEGVSQDLVRLVVVTVADVGCSNEELKRVILVQVQRASFYLLLQLPHALLPIAVKKKRRVTQIFLLSERVKRDDGDGRIDSPAESQVFFVAPEDRRSCSDCGFGQHVMQDDHLDHRQMRLVSYMDKIVIITLFI